MRQVQDKGFSRTLFRFVAALVLATGGSCVQSVYGPAESEVTSVPLWTAPLPSPQYSGYVSAPGSEKYVFYQLFVSQQSPAEDPLVVSLPGGPGGSIAGADIGPFLYSNSFTNPAKPSLIPENVTVSENLFSWTKAANLLLMDSVAGVGYSYSMNQSDYITNDSQAQIDMEATLREWFRMYPYFANHAVFLQGGSYAGIYVPLLGEAILSGNEDGATPSINLEGYLIGNGATDSATDNINIFSLFSTWPLLPQSLAANLTSYNCGTLSNPIDADQIEFTGSNQTQVDVCTELSSQVDQLISYNVNSLKWTGDCFYGLETFLEALTNQISAQLAAEGIEYQQSLAGSGAGAAGSSGNAGCNEDERAVHVYFNRADVREALHVQAVQEEAGFWLGLNPRVATAYTYDITSVIPQHEFLISRGVRALIYSGDLDWQVPWTGSQYWTSQMGATLGIVGDWQPWFRPDPLNFGSQLSGFITQYEGLAFMTFKAAGHHVTSNAPDDAYIMFTNFIDNTLNATTVYTGVQGGLQSSIGIQ